MATKLLAVVATVLIASCAAEDCSAHQDNCSTEEKYCLFSCDDDGTCSPEGNCPTLDQDPLPSDAMDAATCQKACKDDNTNQCAFYRYEKIYKTAFCYLMNKEQCKDEGDDCNDGCISGAVDCTGDNIVEPEDFTCPSGTPHQSGVIPHFNLHWNCQDVNGNKPHDITQDSPAAPGNTVCTAKPSCIKDAKDQNYVFKCVKDVKDGASVASGKWEWQDNGNGATDPTQTLVDQETKKLKEATCDANPLTILDYNNQVDHGMEILCVGEQIAAGIVPAENSCILVCDGYPILNFYTKKAEWFYTMMDSPDVPLPITNSGEIIFCYKP